MVLPVFRQAAGVADDVTAARTGPGQYEDAP
jgi:hypothetical protein